MDGPPNKNPPEAVTSEGFTEQSGGHQLDSKDTPQALRQASRRSSFQAQEAAQVLLRGDAALRFPDEYAGSVWRTVNCIRCRSGEVEIVRSIEHGTASYKGLQTCGSVWLCTRCAAKIQERRRGELAVVFVGAKDDGQDVLMVTYTFPHRATDGLADLRKKQAKALAILRNSRKYKRLMASIGYGGMIRTLEIQHGANGWHPHTHEALLFDPSMVPVTHREQVACWLRSQLSDLWLHACSKVGLFVPGRDKEWDFHRHAVHVLDNATFEYLAKQDAISNWDLTHEMTKQASKASRGRDLVHPFKLPVRGSPGDGAAFIEYAIAIKGARQIYFSPGLRARFGLDEKTDEEIAQEEVDKTTRIAGLPFDVWRFILRRQIRAEVLDAAEQGGIDGISRLLQTLGFIPPEREPAR